MSDRPEDRVAAPTPLGRHSLLRRVVAEPVTALVVQRVLVMDVAHPLVAAAVEHHSDFRSRPWRRVLVTMDVALRLVFGSTSVARAAARQISTTHDRIQGTLAEDAGEWPAGTSYTAHDATLLRWVWATLVDSVELAYTRWVRPFAPGEAEAYYAEMVAFGRFVGIPSSLLPVDRPAFASYLDTMVGSETLGGSDLSRTLARQVLWYQHRTVPRQIVRLERVLALVTLDPRLRDRAGLRLDAADEQLGARADDWLRRNYRHLPRARAWFPHVYLLLRRPSVGLAQRLGAVPSRR